MPAMISAVPPDPVGRDRVVEDDRAEGDPDHGQQVGHHRGPGGAPGPQDREIDDVREPGAEEPQPEDGGDRAPARASRSRTAGRRPARAGSRSAPRTSPGTAPGSSAAGRGRCAGRRRCRPRTTGSSRAAAARRSGRRRRGSRGPARPAGSTPANPTARPATRASVIRSSGRNIGAITMTASGTVALRIDASAESIDCSPMAISDERQHDVDDRHHQQVAVHAGLAGERLAAAATTAARNRPPTVSRAAISVSGGRDSRPILIHR